MEKEIKHKVEIEIFGEKYLVGYSKANLPKEELKQTLEGYNKLYVPNYGMWNMNKYHELIITEM